MMNYQKLLRNRLFYVTVSLLMLMASATIGSSDPPADMPAHDEQKMNLDASGVLCEKRNGTGEDPKEENMPGKPDKPIAQGPYHGPVMKAMEDLAGRLSVEVDQIKLLEVRKVTWPDSSLGCPQSKKVYRQEPRDGLLIRLKAGGRMYFYHSSETRDPFLCEGTSQVVPKVTPKHDEFVPPPDHEID